MTLEWNCGVSFLSLSVSHLKGEEKMLLGVVEWYRQQTPGIKVLEKERKRKKSYVLNPVCREEMVSHLGLSVNTCMCECTRVCVCAHTFNPQSNHIAPFYRRGSGCSEK